MQWVVVLVGPEVFLAAGSLVALTARRRGAVVKGPWMIAGLAGMALCRIATMPGYSWLTAGGVAVILGASIVTLAVGGTLWRRSS